MTYKQPDMVTLGYWKRSCFENGDMSSELRPVLDQITVKSLDTYPQETAYPIVSWMDVIESMNG